MLSKVGKIWLSEIRKQRGIGEGDSAIYSEHSQHLGKSLYSP